MLEFNDEHKVIKGSLKKNDNKNYTDMSSELYKYADAKYKKVIKGKNKKHWL